MGESSPSYESIVKFDCSILIGSSSWSFASKAKRTLETTYPSGTLKSILCVQGDQLEVAVVLVGIINWVELTEPYPKLTIDDAIKFSLKIR